MNHSRATFCNPLNISYRFRVRGGTAECFREAADPSVVRYQDEYWLFPSKSGGYWHSADLRKWTFVATRVLPTENYAPDVRVIDQAIYFTASRTKGSNPIFRTTNPKEDKWEKVSEPFSYADPNMFQDDDGRVYLYYGCSNKRPIIGIEMDRKTMLPAGDPSELIFGHPDEHGWERSEDNNTGDAPPWIEGAWMTKHKEQYYLQYAAPGTQLNVYGDGVYVGRRPLGPFRYAPHNPFSFKPGGFINGAGHGSTFWDAFGNLWHIATMRISVKHSFERRIGLFPAGFDEDGILFCNTSFGDYPANLPSGKWNPWEDSFTGWMLLSCRKTATASSFLPGYLPENAFNEDIRTWWSAASGNEGEWLQVDLGDVCLIQAVQINFAENNCRQYEREGDALCHQYLFEASPDGQDWVAVCDKRRNEEDVPHDYLEMSEPVSARYLKLTNYHMPGGGTFAVSGLRVFGKGRGALTDPVSDISATRGKENPLNARVRWRPANRASGYQVRWGIAPDKLYSSWLLYGQTELDLRALNGGTAYWLAVDAFNENGVVRGPTVKVR